ncbi:MAG: class I SAM-dependent methyltransferase [Pyrinomonadaceae bacterium]
MTDSQLNTNPAAAPRRIVYDRLAKHYDCAFEPLEKWFLKKLRAETLRQIPPDSRILEIGCGTGLNFSYYQRNGRGVASELSREMIARAKPKPRPAGIHLAQAGVEALPFAENSFDAAFATLVFCSIASPLQAFAELRRVVRPGGTIALLEHVRPNNFLAPLFDMFSIVTVPLFDDHFNRRTANEARRAGLEITRIDESLRGIIQLIVCRNPICR